MAERWQIWLNVDKTEVATLRKVDMEKYPFMVEDVDGRRMELLHEFDVDPTGDEVSDIKRAFQYANKWRHDEGEWPDGCRAVGGGA